MPYQVCIGNLYPDVDVSRLCETFGKYGRILAAAIAYDEKNLISLCKGSISYDNPSSIQAACQLNGKSTCLGRGLIVKADDKYGSEENALTKKESFTKIFVKNIDLNWDEIDLAEIFERFGKVEEAKISETDGKSNGYGFVLFHKYSAAKDAIASFNGKVVKGKKLIVEPYIEKKFRSIAPLDKAKDLMEKSAQRNNLHVKNLPKSTSEKELEALFRVFGPILSLKVARDEIGQCKGFGFVCYHMEADAKKALDRMNQYSYKSKTLEVNYCQKKGFRQQYFKIINSNESQIRKFDKEKELPHVAKSSALFAFSG